MYLLFLNSFPFCYLYILLTFLFHVTLTVLSFLSHFALDLGLSILLPTFACL